MIARSKVSFISGKSGKKETFINTKTGLAPRFVYPLLPKASRLCLCTSARNTALALATFNESTP